VEWTTPSTTAESSLYYSPRARRVPVVPRFADLSIERKIRFFVGEIANGDEGKEGGGEEEHVDREDGAGVQERPGDSH